MMPRRSFTYHYSVSSLTYSTQDMKERSQREAYFITEERKYGGKTYYFGFSLAAAQRAFWHACREASTNPLAIRVTVYRNSEVFMSVAPGGI